MTGVVPGPITPGWSSPGKITSDDGAPVPDPSPLQNNVLYGDWKVLHRHMKRVRLPAVDPGVVAREMALHYDLLIPLHRRDPLRET